MGALQDEIARCHTGGALQGDAQVGPAVQRGREIEVASHVERLRGMIRALEVEVLDFRTHLERVAETRGPIERTFQHSAGIALERRAVGAHDVAKHSRDVEGHQVTDRCELPL